MSFLNTLLVSLQQLEMVEPSGWIHISLLNQVRQQISNAPLYAKI